ASKPCRTIAQRANRPNHPARKEQPPNKREHESRQHQDARTHNGGIDWRECLLDWQLDKDVPAERCDERVRAQDLTIPDVSSDGLGFGPIQRLRARRLHVRKPREIGIAQDQTDVRMRNQTTVLVDYKGLPALTDLDLRNHVPNELEVDFREDHAVLAS